MSHSVVLVVVPTAPSSKDDLERQLSELLAPFDENRQVDRYKDYLTVPPANWRDLPWVDLHWPVSGLIEPPYERPADPEAVAEWRQRPASECVAACELSDPAAVAAALNAKWGEDEDDRYEVDEQGAYRWSTYNPQSKWDWWQLGGRWTGELLAKEGAPPGIVGENSWASDPAAPGTYDALPLNALDLDAMRTIRAMEARKTWADAMADDKVDQREWRWGVRPDDTEESFVERRSANPLSSWAVLAEGVWRERGRMGWFGMSDATPESEQDFDIWLNKFLLVAADSPAWIAVVDVHI